MSLIREANEKFLKKQYKEAYLLYIKLNKQFPNLFDYQIKICKQYIDNEDMKMLSFEESEVKLDDVTKILLNNANQLKLSEEERKTILERIKKLFSKKCEDVETKPVNPVPADWPKDLTLNPLPDSTNDFEWYDKYIYPRKKEEEKLKNPLKEEKEIGLSIVIPTFNRSQLLDITLACLVNQKTNYQFEVIVADDGSKENLELITRQYENKLDIKLVRQKDYGYQLCAVRNLGLRTAKYPYVAILDCDMAPNRLWVESYMNELVKNDDIALIGPRKYVDTSHINGKDVLNVPDIVEKLPEVKSDNKIAAKEDGGVTKDWRLEHFKKTENLRLCDTPFRYFSGGNVAFAKKWLDIAGWFDEEFTHWGGEDNEFGYRLYRSGCYFKALEGAMAYHQEPPGKENETDRAEGQKITRKLVEEKVPYFYRKLYPIETSVIRKVPLVSIYIPAYNCEDTIVRCVESALNQTVTDLEVCICNDGSTDNTLEVIEKHFKGNPRVRYVTQKNGGIGKASNTAVKMCRGFYIGQLDSDDYLEPQAVEVCLKEFMKDKKLACVYTTNRNVNPDGSLISNGYNWPVFSREKLATAMIAHHFRMFTIRAWHLAGGFNEEITNAVDYDMYLKLSEIGPFKHINKICYNRVLHGENTSIKKLDIQKKNHFKVVNDFLKRNNVEKYSYEPVSDDKACRKYKFEVKD